MTELTYLFGVVAVLAGALSSITIWAPRRLAVKLLAVGVLLAVKNGIRGLDVITLGIAGFMIVGPLVSGASLQRPPQPI